MMERKQRLIEYFKTGFFPYKLILCVSLKSSKLIKSIVDDWFL